MAATEENVAWNVGKIDRHLTHRLGTVDRDEDTWSELSNRLADFRNRQADSIMTDGRQQNPLASSPLDPLGDLVHDLTHRQISRENVGPNWKPFYFA